MKPTIGALVAAHLSLNPCPPDEQIISNVLEQFPESRIDRTHIAWYKTQFKAGRYTGETETINQPVVSTHTRATKASRVAERISNLRSLVAELKKSLK